MLQIPLRARLTSPVQSADLTKRRLDAVLTVPMGKLLVDTPVTRLPKLPRLYRK